MTKKKKNWRLKIELAVNNTQTNIYIAQCTKQRRKRQTTSYKCCALNVCPMTLAQMMVPVFYCPNIVHMDYLKRMNPNPFGAMILS